jgi:sugar lactone lactonase YvrE
VDRVGDIYVGDDSSNVIHRFAWAGANLRIFASIGPGLLKLTFDTHGNLYAARGGVVRVAPNGTKTEFGSIPDANGVAVCKDRPRVIESQ